MICGQRYGLFLNEQGFGAFFLRHPLKLSYLCGMKRALRIRGRRIWAVMVAVAAAIALVAGTTLPAVSNARKRIARKLFQLESAELLHEKLSEFSQDEDLAEKL